MSKILVTYFSASGVTSRVAKDLANLTGADVYEIKPVKKYSRGDLDWTSKLSRSSIEMQNLNSRPEIENDIPDLSNYEIIFIGFPVWWYSAPRIINTFIEKCDLSGKILIPFATSGGSGVEKCANDLKKSYPDLNWKPGKLLNGEISENVLKGWY